MQRISLWLLLLASALALPAVAAERFYLKNGDRVLFMGDSITHAGMYVQYVDAYLKTRFPDRKFELYNLGLPSETVTGLSEPDHPFPRPDMHERFERALTRIKPTVVVMCYGMNDGIYYPFSEERFRKYQQAYRLALDKARAAGARVMVLTPPPFDPVPLKEKALPLGAPKYSWMTPYAQYDTVLARYAAWLTTQKGGRLPVVDMHGALARVLGDLRRSDPGFILAYDGVHMDATGHALMARTLLDAWNAPAEVDRAEIDAARQRAVHGKVQSVQLRDGVLSFAWTTRLPMPADPKWDARMDRAAGFTERLNRHRLIVRGLPAGSYTLWEGDARIGEVTADELRAGVSLTRYPALSTNVRAAELLKLVQQRERLLSAAWVTEVGHKRPQTPVGLPLAEAQARAAPLTTRIDALAQPITLQLRLTPVR